MDRSDHLQERLRKLGLHGLCSRFDEIVKEPWVETMIAIEEEERAQRSLERRIRRAKIGTFKPMADFDWDWPTKIDREAIEDLFSLSFLAECANVVLVGPNGVGKSTIAANLAHQALLEGHRVLAVHATDLLNDLSRQDTSTALARRLRRYTQPTLLLIEELGYLSYDTRLGDLLFEVVNRRHAQRSTILTTNLAFSAWNEIFPSSTSVTAMVDRLVHKAEILTIEGGSYRLREAKERAARKAAERAKRKKREPGDDRRTKPK